MNFSQHLIIHNGEPRVLDLHVAEALEYAQPRDVRKIITRRMEELQRYGEVCATVAQTSPAGGRPGNEFHLNEGQALLVCALSETAKAADAREILIKTFMDWRSGNLNKPMLQDAQGNRLDITSEAVPVLTAKLAMVREARHLWGHERARAIWKQLGLAVAVDDLAQGTPEGRHVLMLIMQGEFEGHTLGHLVSTAMDGDENTCQLLRTAGIMCLPDEDHFIIANRHPVIARVLEGTGYERNKWNMQLRRLPGASPTKTKAWPLQATSRGIAIPATALDFSGENNP